MNQLSEKEQKIQQLIELELRDVEHPFFIQIGSNDGLRGDPIRDLIIRNPSWRGIFVEPIPNIFEKLKINYKNEPRFVFENSAIGEENGIATIYHVPEGGVDDETNYPSWYHQVGSFNRSHVIKFLGEKVAPFIVEEKVNAIRVADLLAKHHVDKVDFLHIDTEGFDYKVLSQFDFATIHPRVVMYEHKHVPTDQQKLAANYLLDAGFLLEKFGGDTVGIKPRAANARGSSNS